MSFTIVLTSYSNSNVFKKNKARQIERKQALAKFEKLEELFLKSNSNVNIPTVIKSSSWDVTTTNWMNNYANVNTYVNSRITEGYQTSYSLTDTFGKYVYTYDLAGRISLIEYKNFDPVNHTFYDNGRQTYTYTLNGGSTVLTEQYDMGTNTWVPNIRITSAFDSHGNQIKTMYEFYDATNGWYIGFASSRYIVYYNSTNKIAQEVDSAFNSSTMMMEANFGMTRSFNSLNQVVRIENFSYDNGIAILDEIDSIHYNANGLPAMLTAYNVFTMDPQYRLDNIVWSSFNPDIDLFENEPASYIENEYSNSIWQITGRFTTTSPDNFGSKIQLSENYVNNVYIPSYRYSKINNSHLDLVLDADEEYDEINAKWNTNYGSSYAYQYDMNNNMIEKITSYRYQNDTAYQYNEKLEYSNFISITQGISESKTLDLKLYPNPSNDGKVLINLNLVKASSINIELVDINGRLVNVQHEDLGQGLNTVELNGLNKGLYFVIITSDFGVSRTKLIVK